MQVKGTWQVKFNISSFEKVTDLRDKCAATDAYVIFYDTTSPQTVAIYDSFIQDIIRDKHKSVRVIGIVPLSSKSSVRRKSMKSRSITSGWGIFHRTIKNKRENETEIREVYRDVATELMQDRGIAAKPVHKMIGGLFCFY